MQPCHVTPKAMAVLVSLAEAAPHPVSREELIDGVWGERCVSDEVLTHAITELRHALGDSPGSPEYIQTIPKQGYRLFRVVRPLASPGQSREKMDRGPTVQRPAASGFEAKYRNPIVSVMVVAGFVAALAALYFFQNGRRNELLVPDRATTTDMPGLATSSQGPTSSPGHVEASELLLQAAYFERRLTPGNNVEAEILLEKAVSIEPRNASAWALLGRVYYQQARLFRSRPAEEGSELARQAVQRALAIDSTIGPAYASLALVNMTFDFDFNAAFEHLRRAQDLSPTDPHVLRVAAKMEMTHGHVDHAIDLLERSARIDSNSCMAHSDLGRAYYFAGRFDDAEEELVRSISLNPEVIGARYLLGLVRLARGSGASALTAMQEEPDTGLRTAGIALVLYAMDATVSSDEALAGVVQPENEPRGYHVATVYAFRGQNDEALDWLERAYEQRDGEVILLLVDPLLLGLRSQARWQSLVEKLGLPQRN
jgi:DNA-binding winged helix-turn-helix (wHTH) protein/Flp pilus assembly protein TadD